MGYTLEEGRKEIALSIIRFDQDEFIPQEQTRKRLKNLGYDTTSIDNLFSEIEAEEKNYRL